MKGIGGSERSLLELLPRLAAEGHEVRMLVLASGHAERFIRPLSASKIPVAAVPVTGDVTPRLPGRIGRTLRAWPPDVIHTHLIHANLYGGIAARLAGIPSVASHHDALPALAQRRYRPVAMAIGRLPSRTIVISEHVGGFVARHRLARPGTVRWVPYGVDGSRWAVTEDERATARHDLGLAPDDIVVTAASALIPGKGQATLLRAARDLTARDPAVRLLIAGDGPERQALERLARDCASGSVRFLGWIAEIERVLAASDVLVIPTERSLGEGFGMIALEAMAAGVPVVASAVGALPEVVRDGVSGLVVPPTAAGFRDAIGELASDPERREELARGARAAAEAFTMERSVRATIDVYRELV